MSRGVVLISREMLDAGRSALSGVPGMNRSPEIVAADVYAAMRLVEIGEKDAQIDAKLAEMVDVAPKGEWRPKDQFSALGATTDLRRWAIEQAITITKGTCDVGVVVSAAERIMEYVQKKAKP